MCVMYIVIKHNADILVYSNKSYGAIDIELTGHDIDLTLFKLTSICSAQGAPFGMLSLCLHKSLPDLFALFAAGKGP